MSKYLLRGLLALGVVLLLSTGCGIFSSKSGSPTSGTSSYTGETGSLVFHVVWPVKATKATRAIPPEAVQIDIEITGEGLATARTETIIRPDSQKRIDNLPIGQKGITATAKDKDNKVLAVGFASVVVEPNAVKDVAIELQPLQQSDIALARAMIQDVRDAGVALGSSIGQEIASQTSVFALDIIPIYGLTLQRLDFLNTVLTKVYLEGAEVPTTLSKLDPATYQAKLEVMAQWGQIFDWRVVLTKIGDAPASDTWVVKFPDEDALVKGMELTFKLTGQPNNNYEVAPWEFKVKSSNEPQLDYNGNLTLETDSQNRLTKAIVNGTFKDKFLPDGILVQATLSGTPAGQQSYTKLIFSGSITSPKVSLSIEKAEANFQPPSPDEKKWSNYLTSATLTNLKFETKNVVEPIQITGNLSVEADVTQASPDYGPLIKKGNFTGQYVSNNTTFDGSISFDWQNPQRKRLQETPKGTATLQGRWAVVNRPVFSAKFTLNAPNLGKFSVDIDLTRGTHYLRGKLDGTWEIKDGALKVTDWSVNLANENNVKVQFSKTSNAGEIFGPTGQKAADIQRDPDLKILVVKYVDGTLESLQPVNIGYQPPVVTGIVKGRVLDATTNEPIPSAEVWSGWDVTWTDEQGYFQVEALAGHQTIQIWHWDYEEKWVEVDVPARGTVDVGDILLQPWD